MQAYIIPVLNWLSVGGSVGWSLGLVWFGWVSIVADNTCLIRENT
jgi:hypothetical protein